MLGIRLIEFWVVVIALTLWKSRQNRESKSVIHSIADLESIKVRMMSGNGSAVFKIVLRDGK